MASVDDILVLNVSTTLHYSPHSELSLKSDRTFPITLASAAGDLDLPDGERRGATSKPVAMTAEQSHNVHDVPRSNLKRRYKVQDFKISKLDRGSHPSHMGC